MGGITIAANTASARTQRWRVCQKTMIAPIVGASRLYRGMHHLTDVVVGAIVGALALLITWAVVRTRRSDWTSADVGTTSSPIVQRGQLT